MTWKAGTPTPTEVHAELTKRLTSIYPVAKNEKRPIMHSYACGNFSLVLLEKKYIVVSYRDLGEDGSVFMLEDYSGIDDMLKDIIREIET